MTFIVDCPPGYFCAGPTMKIVIPAGSIIFTPTDFGPNPPAPGQPWYPASGVYDFYCSNYTVHTGTAPYALSRQQQGAQWQASVGEASPNLDPSYATLRIYVAPGATFSKGQTDTILKFMATCRARPIVSLPTHATLNITFSEIT
jgi:hypothetical protein